MRTTSHVTLMRQEQGRPITGQTPKGTGTKHNHLSIHHTIMHFMREAIANALRDTRMPIHSHVARIIPQTDIKGLAHALPNQIMPLLISLHTAISVAMAMKKTPTGHITDIQTSAIDHKMEIEDAIIRNRDKKTVVMELIRIARTRQTVWTMGQRTTGINVHIPITNVRSPITIIASRDASGHILMNRAIHPIRPRLADKEKIEVNSNPNNSRVTTNSLVAPLRATPETAGGRKSTSHKLKPKGWKNRQSVM